MKLDDPIQSSDKFEFKDGFLYIGDLEKEFEVEEKLMIEWEDRKKKENGSG